MRSALVWLQEVEPPRDTCVLVIFSMASAIMDHRTRGAPRTGGNYAPRTIEVCFNQDSLSCRIAKVSAKDGNRDGRTIHGAALYPGRRGFTRHQRELLVKKQCLYSKYSADHLAFQQAIIECIEQASDTHQEALASLLTLKFQSFTAVQVIGEESNISLFPVARRTQRKVSSIAA